jgi:hypothetical protein
VNTAFLLMAEFGGSEIPLEQLAVKYFGLSDRQAKERASLNKLPVPAYRMGSQKSPWLVSANDLADFIDKQREQARAEWQKMNGRP